MNTLLLVCPPYPEIEKLLKVAEEISSALGGSITALCVRSDIAQKYYSPFSIQLGKVDKEEERKVFEDITRVLGERDVVKLSRGGELVSQVLDEIEKGDYELLIFGDVETKLTKKLAEYSHVSTLIYRRGEHIERILVCTDGSEPSLSAAKFAGRLARGIDGKIIILSVAKNEDERLYAEKAIEKAKRVMEEIEVEEKIIIGDVREAILAEGKNCDLVVLAPRGLSKLHRVLLGHVSLHVVEKADTNVLLVR
ncbi:universal stress protein [Candidatus Pyrohabitans sp.]